MFDHPSSNDNRHYQYPIASVTDRAEYEQIVEWISPGSSVIDFGCGDGSLLDLLVKRKSCKTMGLELTESGVSATRLKKIEVLQKSIDEFIPEIQSKSFDYAVCSVTLQMVMYPEKLLSEMARVSHKQILSFPNFGHFRNRLDLLFYGRMPRPMLFEYTWYSTGHIHQLSVRDFVDFCHENDFTILESAFLGPSQSRLKKMLIHSFPNFLSTMGIFLIQNEHQ